MACICKNRELEEADCRCCFETVLPANFDWDCDEVEQICRKHCEAYSVVVSLPSNYKCSRAFPEGTHHKVTNCKSRSRDDSQSDLQVLLEVAQRVSSWPEIDVVLVALVVALHQRLLHLQKSA